MFPLMSATEYAPPPKSTLAPQSIHTARLIEESGVAKPCGLPGATWLMRSASACGSGRIPEASPVQSHRVNVWSSGLPRSGLMQYASWPSAVPNAMKPSPPWVELVMVMEPLAA